MSIVPVKPRSVLESVAVKLPFTHDEVKRSIALLQALVNDRLLVSQLPDDDRQALLIAAGRISRPFRDEQLRATKEFRKVRRHDAREADRAVRAETEIRAARRATVFEAPAQITDVPGEPSGGRELSQSRDCYVCKTSFTRLHFFYDSMCASCAELNYQKRFQSAPLHGKVAVITGARLKIGYYAALMMLRAGARVIVTTRFPHDSAHRFARESDFKKWSDRIQVYGLDLRHSPSVEIFTRSIDRSLDRLDILINNAAQTVRRPPGFYAHLLEIESQDARAFSDDVQSILREHMACKRALIDVAHDQQHAPQIDAMALGNWHRGGAGMGITQSAFLSQIPCAFDESQRALDVFPLGATDPDLQQIDLRTNNSWRMALADVPTPELVEVHLVNAVAPFILCSKLKPLMMRDRTDAKHIVNVSAMEGKFSRHTKTDKHPHTNMAKAALNMMTLTSAPDYAKSGIYMNAVDTGWVTDEDPAVHSVRKQAEHDFQPPLDIVDGAARVCDPFFSGILSGNHLWGKFLKDYMPTSW
jgi:NAD(P)-dependent dehydrogenase (short-subunit alcohol dehydrogenase family)